MKINKKEMLTAILASAVVGLVGFFLFVPVALIFHPFGAPGSKIEMIFVLLAHIMADSVILSMPLVFIAALLKFKPAKFAIFVTSPQILVLGMMYATHMFLMPAIEDVAIDALREREVPAGFCHSLPGTKACPTCIDYKGMLDRCINIASCRMKVGGLEGPFGSAGSMWDALGYK